MRIVRIKLLITLILVAMASITMSTTSAAYSELDSSPDPFWIAGADAPDGVVLDGEPDAGGNGSPPPSQGKYGAGRIRSEAPVSAVPTYRLWLTWMSRIWAARLWGTPF